MADEKKKSDLLGKLWGKKQSSSVFSEAQKQDDLDRLMDMSYEVPESTDSNDSESEYAEWLSEVANEVSQESDEDISEALAELFDDAESDTGNESPAGEISAFEELAASSEEYGISNIDDGSLYSDDEASGDQQPDDQDEGLTDTAEDTYEEYPASDEGAVGDLEVQTNEEAKEQRSSSVDEDTAVLLAALGYSDANAAKVKAASKDNSHSRPADLSLAHGYSGKEYVARSQASSVKSDYSNDKLKMIIRSGATTLVAVLLFVYDMFGNKFGGALDVTIYPVVNIMISLQLLLIAAAFSAKRLWSGISTMFKGDLSVHSISAIAVIITIIYDIILSVAAPETFTLYNFPASVVLLYGCIYDYFNLCRETVVFNRLSSWKSVVTLDRVDSGALAAELGEIDATGDTNTVGQAFRLRKGIFAENYFRHVNRRHPMSRMLAFFVTPSIALAFIACFITLAYNKTFVEAANVFVAMMLFTLPAFLMFSISFPFFTLVNKNLNGDSVILSEADVTEYRRVDTVVLEESDLFDENSLIINRISVCDNNQMHNAFDIMCGVSAMYNKIGGRIAGVFRASIADGDAPADVTVLRVEDGGFEGIADGKHYFVGSEKYLASKQIPVMRYYDDKYVQSNPGGTVLHIAVDGTEVFKLYLTYSISPSTLSVIHSLAASDTRIVMRTIDPNVNMDLISSILTNSFEGNFTLVRKPYDGAGTETHRNDESIIEGGILANGEAAEAIFGTVQACRFFSAFSKLNFYAGVFVFALAVLVSLFFGVLGVIINVPSICVFSVQFLTIIPCVLAANVYLNKD